MNKLTRYKVVNLPFPGRVNLLSFGDVDLHTISDKLAHEIHASGEAKKLLIPVGNLTSPQQTEVKPARRRRRLES